MGDPFGLLGEEGDLRAVGEGEVHVTAGGGTQGEDSTEIVVNETRSVSWVIVAAFGAEASQEGGLDARVFAEDPDEIDKATENRGEV